METKVCTRCKQEKLLTDFQKCARAKDGLQWECRYCKSARAKVSYQNPEIAEKRRAQHREWQSRNKEHIKKYGQKYKSSEYIHVGRGNYDRMYSSELIREDFDSQEDFYLALTKYQGRSQRFKAAFYINELKSVPCTDCEQLFDTVCMDFDHLPEYEKRYDISYMVKKGMSLKRIAEEVSKCEIVCANCHRLRTKKRWLDGESEVQS